MSNPSVIILENIIFEDGTNFRVEDNIGECIHIHYENYRYDFSIAEFLQLEEILKLSITSLIDIENFNLDDFDIKFLSSIGDKLMDLSKIELENVNINDLLVYKYYHKIPYVVNIQKSFIKEALKGKPENYIKYSQRNNYEETNIERLNKLQKHIKQNNYQDIKPIVLFNDQNIIRDGQHRSAIFLEAGINKIQAIKMYFTDNKHNISLTPIYGYLFNWNITRIKNTIRFFLKIIRRLKMRLKFKFKAIRQNIINK